MRRDNRKGGAGSAPVHFGHRDVGGLEGFKDVRRFKALMGREGDVEAVLAGLDMAFG